MYILLTFLIVFIVNFLFALGVRVVMDDMIFSVIDKRWFRLVILIPPLAILILLCMWVFFIFYTMWDLFKSYMK
jgi:hypothetical protein